MNPPASPLRGRTAELAAARDVLDEALGGAPAVVLVSGEAGIGKTRVAQTLARAAEGRGAAVVWGRTTAGPGSPPYGPWIRVLRQLGRALPADTLTHLLGAAAPLLRGGSLLEPRSPGGPAGSSSLVAGEPERAREVLGRALAAVAAEASAGGLVVVLEDLHDADADSLELLATVAEHLGDAAVLVVATYRDGIARRIPGADAALARAGRHGIRLVLGPLSPADVDALVRDEAADDATPEMAAAVVAASGGNPLFARELARLWRARDGGALIGDLPNDVRDVIRARVAGLPPGHQQVLVVAAVVGRAFDVTVVSWTSGLRRVAVVEALEAARAEALVRPQAGETTDRWEFRHGLVPETLAGDLTSGVRMELHAQVAAALERRTDVDVSELAAHWIAAGRAGDPGLAIARAREAGERALAAAAASEAAHWFKAALSTAGGDERSADRADLLLSLGTALLRAGEVGEAAHALHEAYRTADGDATRVQAAARLTAAVTRAVARGDDPDPAPAQLLAEAMSFPVDDDRVWVEGLVTYALQAIDGYRLGTGGDALAARAAVERALAVAQRAGHPDLLASAWWAGWLTAADGSDEQDAAVHHLRAAAADAADPEWRLRALRLELAAALRRGALPEVARLAEQHAAAARQAHDPHHLAVAAETAVLLATARGELDEAASLVAGATLDGYARRLDVPVEVLRREQHGQLDVPDEAAPFVRAGAALSAAIRGDEQRAQALMWDVLGSPLIELVDLRPHPWVATVFRLGETAAMLRDASAAARLERLLEPLRGTVASYAALAAFGPVDTVRGELLLVLERYDEALEAFEAAATLAESAAARLWRGHAQVGAAQARLARKGPGDVAAARVLVSSAAATAAACGARRLEALAEGVGAAVEAVAAADPGGPEPAGVFRLEGDAWRIRYSGRAFMLRDARGLRHLSVLLGAPGRPVAALLFDVAHRAGTDVDVVRAGVAESSAGADLDAVLSALGAGQEDAERARWAVSRAVRSAVQRIGRHDEALARHLSAAVRMGAVCVYEPESPVAWEVG